MPKTKNPDTNPSTHSRAAKYNTDELSAMRKIGEILGNFSEEGRRRIIRYLVACLEDRTPASTTPLRIPAYPQAWTPPHEYEQAMRAKMQAQTAENLKAAENLKIENRLTQDPVRPTQDPVRLVPRYDSEGTESLGGIAASQGLHS